jgi:membrane-bound lytic murein transglycosylase D
MPPGARARSCIRLLAALLLAAPPESTALAAAVEQQTVASAENAALAENAAPAENADPERAADGPLLPLQGHEAAEIFSIPVPDEDVIDRYVDGLLATRTDWLQAVLDRSIRYRELIARELSRRGLPPELGSLPALESGFQARAVSPRGAAGLWQLMRNTAAPYGLRMDLWLDERRDARKATEASLGKLAENYAIFGDWCLALAAYNCGAGKLSAIVRRRPGSDFWELRKRGVLPRETAAFVPQFLALCRILGHAGRYGLTVSWNPSPEWAMITMDRCVDLRILSRASGAPLDALVSGNPELNYLVTPPPAYGYELKVPEDFGDAVAAALQGSDLPLLEFRVHVVAQGDTLSGMSVRYKVSVPLIQEFNPTLSPRALRIGSRVLIPLVPPRSSG